MSQITILIMCMSIVLCMSVYMTTYRDEISIDVVMFIFLYRSQVHSAVVICKSTEIT